jgi:hypothetical protein
MTVSGNDMARKEKFNATMFQLSDIFVNSSVVWNILKAVMTLPFNVVTVAALFLKINIIYMEIRARNSEWIFFFLNYAPNLFEWNF